MKRFLIKLYILLLFPNFLFAEISSYSFFYEKDAKGSMIIFYDEDKIFGQIIQYGGYKWFKKTFSNPDDKTVSFVQPAHYGKSGDMQSWMLERYEIDTMRYEFEELNQNHYMTFYSPQATQEIEGYLTRNKPFSFATLSQESWYAGTFLPIKNNKDLEDLMKLNSRTYCYLLNDNDLQNLKNKFLSEKILQVFREPCN